MKCCLISRTANRSKFHLITKCVVTGSFDRLLPQECKGPMQRRKPAKARAEEPRKPLIQTPSRRALFQNSELTGER